MKKKHTAAHQKAALTQKELPEQSLSLMAVQEKLGLFKIRQKTQTSTKEHSYLKNKPLGLI